MKGFFQKRKKLFMIYSLPGFNLSTVTATGQKKIITHFPSCLYLIEA